MTDRYIKSALKQANAIRKEFGKPPVDHLYKGNHSANSCAITNTVYDDDWGDWRTQPQVITVPANVQVWGTGVNKIFPNNAWVEKFINDFDQGKYPDLCLDDHSHDDVGTIIAEQPEVQG